MRLSLETDYALRIISYLAAKGQGEMSNSRKIAEKCCVSEKFTLKVLHKLRRVGLVKSVRGINGGYFINKPPKEITYLDVVNCIEGPLYINKCLTDEETCSMDVIEHCKVRKRLLDVNQIIEEMLAGYTFEQTKDNL